MVADYPNISGIKDATSDVARPPASHYVRQWVLQMSGEDATNFLPGRWWTWRDFGNIQHCTATGCRYAQCVAFW